MKHLVFYFVNPIGSDTSFRNLGCPFSEFVFFFFINFLILQFTVTQNLYKIKAKTVHANNL